MKEKNVVLKSKNEGAEEAAESIILGGKKFNGGSSELTENEYALDGDVLRKDLREKGRVRNARRQRKKNRYTKCTQQPTSPLPPLSWESR